GRVEERDAEEEYPWRDGPVGLHVEPHLPDEPAVHLDRQVEPPLVHDPRSLHPGPEPLRLRRADRVDGRVPGRGDPGPVPRVELLLAERPEDHALATDHHAPPRIAHASSAPALEHE